MLIICLELMTWGMMKEKSLCILHSSEYTFFPTHKVDTG